jgi:hypothetical protein
MPVAAGAWAEVRLTGTEMAVPAAAAMARATMGPEKRSRIRTSF